MKICLKERKIDLVAIIKLKNKSSKVVKFNPRMKN